MELVAVIILSVFIAIFNSFHVIIQWMNNRPGEVFTGIAHSFADYFLYTAQMAQGAAGRWIWSEHLFTNEPTSPTWYYWFNVTLGHIGGWLGLSPFATYNVSLFLLTIALVLGWYFFTKSLYPANRFLRLTSFMMILTISSFFSLEGSHPLRLVGQFWFSPAPVFNRLGGVPYHVFQTILLLLLCMAFAKKRRLVPPLSFLAGIANPVQMLLFVLASRSVPAAVFGGLGAWMANREIGTQAVFTAAKNWELGQYVSNTLPILVLSLGPVMVFCLYGLKNAWRNNDSLRRILLHWGLLSFALFLTPIPRMLGVSPVRFLHPVPYAALAILGAEGLFAFKARNRIVLIAAYLALTLPSLSVQFIDRITPARNPQLLMDTMYNHVPNNVVAALTFLKQQPESGVVLTNPAIPIEVLVPVFTGKPSFSGHPIHTLYPDVKERLRQEFFAGTMADPTTFLADHRIGYIITINNGTITIYTP